MSLTLVLVVLAAGPATPVALMLDTGCTSVPEQELRRLLAIELQRALVDRDAAPASEAFQARVQCPDGEAVQVALTTPDGRSYQRTIRSGATVAGDLPRLLSLTVAELAHQAEGRGAPAPQAVASAPPKTASPEMAAPLQIEVLGGARTQRGALLWGGGMGLSLGLGAIGLLTWELTFEHGSRATALGTVDQNLGSAGMWGGLRGRWGGFLGELALGGRLGLAILNGQSSVAGVRAAAIQGRWAGPSLLGRAAWVFASRFALVLRLELGWATSGVVGEISGEAPVSLEGLFGAFALGVRF